VDGDLSLDDPRVMPPTSGSFAYDGPLEDALRARVTPAQFCLCQPYVPGSTATMEEARCARAVGVSDEEPGFALLVCGTRVRPSLLTNLFDTEMRRVSLLLKNANKDLPAPVTQILNARKSRYLGAFRYV
jgi:hypothetical protein